MPRRRTPPLASLASFCALVAALGAPGIAHAGAGTAFGESSRAAALANSVSARPGDATTVLLNPAGLADVTEPTLVLSGHVDRLSQWFARTGEPREDSSRGFGGFGLAVATPLPGPSWLRRFRFGLALDIPAEHVLRVAVLERVDQPTSPIYDGPPDRISALGALAVALGDRLRLGAGAALTPSLATPTEVGYVAGRSGSVERDVVVRLDRDLGMEVSPFVGVRAQPLDALGLSLVYRDAAISRASGKQRTVAGGILADDPIDYFQFWAPAELVLGTAIGLATGWSISADVTWHRWSDFKTGFDQQLDQPFKDTVSVRSGLEWHGARWLTLRAGYAIEPSPIPEQIGPTNYLGSSTRVLGLGGGVDLRKLVHAPLIFDAHARARLGSLESASKDVHAARDADPNVPGVQISDLGYPGFQARQSSIQLGFTLTLFLGAPKEAR